VEITTCPTIIGEQLRNYYEYSRALKNPSEKTKMASGISLIILAQYSFGVALPPIRDDVA
jgi:hypothetical protein